MVENYWKEIIGSWSVNYPLTDPYNKTIQGIAHFDLALYLNSSSDDVLPIWGAYAHELILN